VSGVPGRRDLFANVPSSRWPDAAPAHGRTWHRAELFGGAAIPSGYRGTCTCAGELVSRRVCWGSSGVTTSVGDRGNMTNSDNAGSKPRSNSEPGWRYENTRPNVDAKHTVRFSAKFWGRRKGVGCNAGF
jgi:hypothetical protein